jgi:hypothetical protein
MTIGEITGLEAVLEQFREIAVDFGGEGKETEYNGRQYLLNSK